jgi:hypothetical protein
MWVTYYNNRPGFGKSTNKEAVLKDVMMRSENVTFAVTQG